MKGPTVSERESLRNVMCFSYPKASTRRLRYAAKSIVAKGWATYSVRTGEWALTAAGLSALESQSPTATATAIRHGQNTP